MYPQHPSLQHPRPNHPPAGIPSVSPPPRGVPPNAASYAPRGAPPTRGIPARGRIPPAGARGAPPGRVPPGSQQPRGPYAPNPAARAPQSGAPRPQTQTSAAAAAYIPSANANANANTHSYSTYTNSLPSSSASARTSPNVMSPELASAPLAASVSGASPSLGNTPPTYSHKALYGGTSPAPAPAPGTPEAIDWQRMIGVNDVTANMGIQLGRNAFESGQAYVERNLARVVPMSLVRHSFNVTNSYVGRKLLLLIFPWRHKPWSRMIRRTDTGVPIENSPPSEDINCPDLYIPTMAITTYILLAAFIAGIKGDFHPEILGRRASTSVGLLFFEYVLIKLGCYLFAISDSGTILEIMAYEGYKFVGVVIAKVLAILGVSGLLFWLVLLYLYFADMFFLLRSLRHLVLPDPSSSLLDHSTTMSPQPQLSHAQRSRRVQFLFFISAFQGVGMFVLAWAW